MIPDEERCTGIVSDGRWTHRCENRAKPGKTKCGVHLPKTVAAEPRDQVAEPTQDSRSERRKFVSLRWDGTDGPILREKYGSRLVQVAVVGLLQHQQRPDHVQVTHILGLVLKADGTPGARDWRETFWDFHKLPQGVQEAALRALAGVAW